MYLEGIFCRACTDVACVQTVFLPVITVCEGSPDIVFSVTRNKKRFLIGSCPDQFLRELWLANGSFKSLPVAMFWLLHADSESTEVVQIYCYECIYLRFVPQLRNLNQKRGFLLKESVNLWFFQCSNFPQRTLCFEKHSRSGYISTANIASIRRSRKTLEHWKNHKLHFPLIRNLSSGLSCVFGTNRKY